MAEEATAKLIGNKTTDKIIKSLPQGNSESATEILNEIYISVEKDSLLLMIKRNGSNRVTIKWIEIINKQYSKIAYLFLTV